MFQEQVERKLDALLKFESQETWNCKRLTANRSLRFAVSREKPDAKGLYSHQS